MKTQLDDFGIIAAGRIEQRVPCPQCNHGPKDRALGINIETGVFHCFRCHLTGRADDGRASGTVEKIKRIDNPAIAERKRERLRKIWRESLPLSDRRAWAIRRYLECRALAPILDSPPAALRAHPGLEYWDTTCPIGSFPAMVALLVNAIGEPVTLHATYLRADGCTKAAVPSPKKILGVPLRGTTRGGAIRLHEPRGGVVGIAEGIESALSLHLLQGLPVWASYCADNLTRIHLPNNLRELHIGVDLDASGKGEEAAKALAARVRQRNRRMKVWFVRPEIEGFGDLNDELRRRTG